MHSATTATGRPSPPPGKTLPKNRPAPLSCRAAHQLAAPKPHVTSQLQCYIAAPAVTSHSSLVYPERVLRRVTQDHCKFNRQPRRLEFAISPTKQTSAPQINRRQIRTLHPALFAGRATSQITTHDSQTRLAGKRVTNHGRSNRHSVRLENAISHRKQTLGTPSNRHFLQVSASRESPNRRSRSPAASSQQKHF